MANQVRLSKIGVRGYRSCKNTRFDIDSRLTALIGPNGAGKTNALQAILLLRLPLRRRLAGEDSDAFTSQCQIQAEFVTQRKTVRFRSNLVLQSGDNNAEDIIRRREAWNFCEFTKNDEWHTLERFDPELFIDRRYDIDQDAYPELSSKLFLKPVKAKSRREKIKELYGPAKRAFESVRDFRRGIEYYSASMFTNPSLCPISFDVDDKGELRGTARGRHNSHATFLRDLYALQLRQPDAYGNYLRIVGENGTRLIKNIGWKSSSYSTITSEVRSGGRVIKHRNKKELIIPTADIRGDELSFNQLSEGTFRALAILFYVMTGKHSLLLLEEPEVCVHHGLLNSLIAIIKEYSRKKQIVLSTHSESIVDMLEPENVRLTRIMDARGTTVESISKTLSKRNLFALKEYLRSAGTLGEYWKHSGFEQ